ncbi:hypothetical protein GGR56DRAFT_367510 [Xylariaceae sp. FL0804]|nr:hypothetical protein GGR56DRAFT_367510 [Xylariaceae sp. FL0804]
MIGRTAMPPGRLRRGMWVWQFALITSAHDGGSALLRGAVSAGVSDLYLYIPLAAYAASARDLRAFNAAAHGRGLRVWGLDGARAYFHDGDGNGEFHAHVAALLAFNAGCSGSGSPREEEEEERLDGFQADNEPADRDGFAGFANGVAQSRLDARQAASRQRLMHDWLTMHADARRALEGAGVRFGVAMPHWLSHYEGEAITVRWPDPARSEPRQVMHHMMALVDEYVIMSYHTNPHVVAHFVDDALRYASGLPAGARPQIHAAVETERGIGANVSYADTEGKASKAVVLADVKTVEDALAPRYGAFAGISIHHWTAWTQLSD